MQRKVIGIGETVLDIIFKNGQAISSTPGGSTFNALVSLGRTHIPSSFISDIGTDKVGDVIVDFLEDNGVSTKYVNRHSACKTSLALAFLNDKNDAEYEFYKDYLNQNPHDVLPEIKANDIILFGSFYAINPNIRSIIKRLLDEATDKGAIIYYDPNFRASHLEELDELRPMILENMKYATVVRGSDEDFTNIFSAHNTAEAYQSIAPFCNNILVTRNANGVDVYTGETPLHVDANKIKTVSTIGAGDSFNAGFIYALIKNEVTLDQLQSNDKVNWEKLVKTAISFSSEVCQSYDNYVPVGFEPDLN